MVLSILPGQVPAAVFLPVCCAKDVHSDVCGDDPKQPLFSPLVLEAKGSVPSMQHTMHLLFGVCRFRQVCNVCPLLRQIGPGEVDNELEDEVAHELQRFGVVEKVLIFEVTEPGFPPHEAVRIFVQFERPEESTKAVVALQGRYFGGRVVRAGFFDERRFDNCDLAPEPGEIDLQGGTGT
ncbi:unnamed protein product [Ostreobium quekettii]|uniref:RNA recognition motif domain-containing protein n=1 Tax=Ostreobium quekettii TaxID=121088 RepID=A0A8S1JIG2_9CHLO|nr:unnamed protein product [Ostreobium quekettii]